MSEARTEAKKVVIFFTDGKPTSQSTFDDGVANDAVKDAKKLKNSGDTVYSIGVFVGANPASTATSENKFMHAVSSNYPNATTYTDRGEGSNAGYYKAATNASDLNSIFEEIQKSETTTHGFTNVSIEDTLSEYVELSDEKYTVTAKDANGKDVALEEGKDYTLTYDKSARKFVVTFKNVARWCYLHALLQREADPEGVRRVCGQQWLRWHCGRRRHRSRYQKPTSSNQPGFH